MKLLKSLKTGITMTVGAHGEIPCIGALPGADQKGG